MQSSRFRKTSTRPDTRRGFTLIELLVVVSIIALLISILLPSLRSAREQAKTVTCMSMQASIGRGMATYLADNNDWLPGSPGTSGSQLLGNSGSGSWDAGEIYIDVEPVQTWDWATPLRMFKHIPGERNKRWRMIVDELICPSNKFLSIPWPDGPSDDWPVQPLVSYNSMRHFMYWDSNAPFSLALYPSDTFDGEHIPSGYQPRIERVGNPADNIFIADGSRFTPDNGQVDHDIDWNARWGGAFSDGGPTLKSGALDVGFLRSYRLDPKLAPITYRHRRGNNIGIAVMYFDGHGAYMSEEKSRFPDPWWPRGTWLAPGACNRGTLSWIGRYLDLGADPPHQGWYKVQR